MDAYALVAFLGDEPAANEVEELLRRSECAITPVNLGEAADICGRVHRIKLVDVRKVVEMLVVSEQLEVVEVPAEAAWRAAALRQAYYKPRTSEVSLADCFLVAAAEPEDAIATADPPVAAMARAEGIEILPLPSSGGERP